MFTRNSKSPRLLQFERLISMRDPALPTQTPPKAEQARDLQAQLYREIGITAVAAALRFTTQPEPGKRPAETSSVQPRQGRDGLAA